MTNENLNDKLYYFKKEILPLCTSAETSYDPEKWSEHNPTKGHCSLVAFFLNKQLGGDVLRCKATIDYPQSRVPFHKEELHFYNRIDGETVDLTGDQYDFEELGGNTVTYLGSQVRPIDRVLDDEMTRKRYETFETKVVSVMAAKKFSFAA